MRRFQYLIKSVIDKNIELVGFHSNVGQLRSYFIDQFVITYCSHCKFLSMYDILSDALVII